MMQRRDKKNGVIADELFVCCLEDVRDFFRCFGRKREGKEGREREEERITLVCH